MLAFIMIELFAKGLIEAHHLGFEGGGVKGFADGGVEGVAVEEGLEGGGDGVKVLLRAVPPETGPKKKEETHYAKPLHA